MLIAIGAMLGYIACKQPECPLYAAVRLQRRERAEMRAGRVLFLHGALLHVLSALNWATGMNPNPSGQTSPQNSPAKETAAQR